MPNLVPELMPRLQAHRLPGLSLDPEMIFPYYQGYSLVNLPASICLWLNVPPLAGSPLNQTILEPIGGPYQQVVLLVMDGLGLNLLQKVARIGPDTDPDSKPLHSRPVWSRILSDGLLAPLTSVVPSTTSTALTTLWTGVSGLAHGILGYEMWLKEYGVIANMIFHSPATFHADLGGLRRAGFQPEIFLPVPTLAPYLQAQDVQVYSFQPASIAHSGLSQMHFAQAQVIPYHTFSDLWVSLEHVLCNEQGRRTYCYIYWGDLDDLGHRYGPDDERIQLELASFGLMVERFLSKMHARTHQRTLLVMTADHGQVATPAYTNYDLKNHPELLACLTMLPSGEGRLPYLFLRPGCEETLRDYVVQVWPETFQLLPVHQALTAGLFGDELPYTRAYDRLGDWIVIPRSGAYWWWADRENSLCGRHGGLSPAEMLVPLVAMEI